MPRKSKVSINNAGKTVKKLSKVDAILRDFDSKVASRLEELEEKKKEYCDEITDECNAILARIPKGHQNMLLSDYIALKRREKEEEENKTMYGLTDDVFESVALALPKNITNAVSNGPTTSIDSRSSRFPKSSKWNRINKKIAASVENLTTACHNNKRASRSRLAMERSVSASQAESHDRLTATRTNPNVLSGAFSAIFPQKQRSRTPNARLPTPLRRCQSGERCLILSESGSPMNSGTEPTIVFPVKDGALVTFSGSTLDASTRSNLDIMDNDTRESLELMHKKLGDFLGRKH